MSAVSLLGGPVFRLRSGPHSGVCCAAAVGNLPFTFALGLPAALLPADPQGPVSFSVLALAPPFGGAHPPMASLEIIYMR